MLPAAADRNRRRRFMPTINQLVRKPRTKVTTKTKSPAMQRVTNNLKTRNYEKPAPFKRGVCVKVPPKPRRSRTRPFVKSPVCASATATKFGLTSAAKATTYKSTP